MQSHEPQDDIRIRELLHAKDLSKSGNPEDAYNICYRWLKVDPNDPVALNLMAYVMLNTDKCAVAYPMLKHLVTLVPDDALAWLNMGMACADLWRYNEAIRCYKKGFACATTEKAKADLAVNIASTMVDHGEFREAEEWCLKAIELNPETIKGRANLGFCQLAQRNWEGWKNYRYCIDSEWRPIVQYNNEPLWDGIQEGTICVYAEQGLGDEISFGSMLPDMQRWCDEHNSKLVVDVNTRLESLFKRSFPHVEVHGTRGEKRIRWDPTDIDYSLPMAQLGEYFRTNDRHFTGKPYLKADPDRVTQWKALFESKGKPVIGIGWRGGIWKTAAKYRQLSLEQLYPVLSSIDAHWVSLQYKPAQKEIDDFKSRHPEIDIVEYPWCTLSGDYDDTVAMIAALDHVITMQTTAVHVAGGLGIPTWVFVPKTSQWRYGQDTEDFPWAKSVKIIRQTERGEWADVMETTGDRLASHKGLTKLHSHNQKTQDDRDVGEKRELAQPNRRTKAQNGRGSVLGESRPS